MGGGHEGLGRAQQCRRLRPCECQFVGIQKSSTPEWSIFYTPFIYGVYLFGDKLTERVAIHSPLHALGTGTESCSQEAHTCFSPAFIIHETTPKVGWYLKDYWLKESPQPFCSYFSLSPKDTHWDFASVLN